MDGRDTLNREGFVGFVGSDPALGKNGLNFSQGLVANPRNPRNPRPAMGAIGPVAPPVDHFVRAAPGPGTASMADYV